MLLQEPVQAAIWDALNNYSYGDAIFLAERLNAEVSNSESLHLLATCYYRAGKSHQAYSLLEKSCCTTPQCKLLQARCCTEADKFHEAERLLAGTILSKVKSHEDIESEFGSLACYVFSLLGYVYSKTERASKASQCYRRSLKLNPLLWKSYEKLCNLGENVKAESIFQIPSQQGSSTVTAGTLTTVTSGDNTPAPISEQDSTGVASSENVQLLSPRNICSNQTPDNSNSQNEPFSHQDLGRAPRINKQKPPAVNPEPQGLGVRRSGLAVNLFATPATPQQGSPSFGLLPVEQPPSLYLGCATPSFISPVPSEAQHLEVPAPIKTRTTTRRTQMGKVPVLNWSNTLKKMKEQEPVNAPAPIRRSSRLFGNTNSNSSAVKENNKNQTSGSLSSPKGVSRRSKRGTKSQQEENEINKGELSVDTKCSLGGDLLQMQQQSLSGILSLLTSLGKAYNALSRYDCRVSIQLFSELPEHQYYTGWVLSNIGKAYYEMTEYQRAMKVFEELRRLEPYHLEGLDIYSSVLWHLHKEVELSLLSQELTTMDRTAPEAWFATGNCFSLQKEHDVAIKFFHRAIQVNPNFVYAYSLLALEYIYLEEFDKGLTCFRNALRLDPRHYQAWYGVGMIYYKQEKFNLAEIHYRKALSINYQSPILVCHIAVAQHAQQKSEQALTTLNSAFKTDPKNPFCMFHKASILFASDKYKEALAVLETLKQIIPKESLVYFLMGKVHKKLGHTHLAMTNFSWAMDLDPKGLNNQIKDAVDKRYVTEDEDPLATMEQDASGLDAEAGVSGLDVSDDGAANTSQDAVPGAAHQGARNSLLSSLLDGPDLQAIESDESL